MNKVEYQGLFFDKENTELLTNKLNAFLKEKNLMLLDKIIDDIHVTFWYKPEERFEDNLLNKEFEINVIGFAQNENNCAFQVKLPKELLSCYRGSNIPHITMYISKNGKPVNSEHLKFKKIQSFSIKGKLGYFIGSRKVMFENKLR